jgi:hypothetical protein
MRNLEENTEVSRIHLTCGKRFCGLWQSLAFRNEPIGIRNILANLRATSFSRHTQILINTNKHTKILINTNKHTQILINTNKHTQILINTNKHTHPHPRIFYVFSYFRKWMESSNKFEMLHQIFSMYVYESVWHHFMFLFGFVGF